MSSVYIYVGTTILTYQLLRLLREKIHVKKIKALLKREIEKRETAEKLRWTERVGRTRAEKELRTVIEEHRKEVDGNSFSFTPIAYAHSCYVHCQGVPRQPGLAPLARSRIDIEDWVPPPAFDDLQNYSHVWIMFVFHMNTNSSTLLKSTTEKGITFPAKVRPPRLNGKSTGLFATRSPHRPNPIGLSVVKLEDLHVWGKERYITVSNTDIVDGSPILDIKPYLPSFDHIENAVVPDWVKHEQSVKKVSFSEASLQQLQELKSHFLYYSSADEMREVITQVLGADVSKRSDRRLSEFRFDCLSILFAAMDDENYVERILLSVEYEKEKEENSLI